MNTSTREEEDWIKLDLHIHTLDDPKDKLDYSAHELLARARRLGFSVLAITLHDAVFIGQRFLLLPSGSEFYLSPLLKCASKARILFF